MTLLSVFGLGWKLRRQNIHSSELVGKGSSLARCSQIQRFYRKSLPSSSILHLDRPGTHGCLSPSLWSWSYNSKNLFPPHHWCIYLLRSITVGPYKKYTLPGDHHRIYHTCCLILHSSAPCCISGCPVWSFFLGCTKPTSWLSKQSSDSSPLAAADFSEP